MTLAAQPTDRVTAIKSDGSLVLAAGGNAVFADMIFPDAKRAESWLAEHVLQQEITFTAGEADRYGRTRISSNAATNMLRDGAAIYYASGGEVAATEKTAEADARRTKQGVWSDKDFLLTPQNAAQHIHEFHVIEGTISRIYEAKSATYLNFGEDWHSDFSITIPSKVRRSMKAELAQLKPGRTVQVRGTLHEENGPMITLTHPDNLEIR